MSDRFVYRVLNDVQTLLQSFPGGTAADSVVYSIYDIDDNATDVSSSAMTNETVDTWSASWTPTQTNSYRIDFFNPVQDVHYYEYVKVVGSIVGSPTGSSGGTTLTNLRTRFLQMIDNYNANDLTGTNSTGAVADLCINDALQRIYAQIKESRYMEAYSSTALASTANQAYIALSGISDIDNISSLKDTTNNLTLLEIPLSKYFLEVPNPANQTGVPYRYCRIFDRIYLDPRPTSAITYTAEYVKIYARLAADSDQALIPNKYDDWIYCEARVLWLMMEDPSNTAAIALATSLRDDAREIYINDVMSDFDLVLLSESHWSSNVPTRYEFKTPIDGT